MSSPKVQLRKITALHSMETDGTKNGVDNPVFNAEKTKDKEIDESKSEHTSSLDDSKFPLEGTGQYNAYDIADEEEEVDEQNLDPLGRHVHKIGQSLKEIWSEHRSGIVRVVQAICLILYFVYFGYCMYYRFGDGGSLTLLVVTVLAVVITAVTLVWDDIARFGSRVYKALSQGDDKRFRKIIRWMLYVVSTVLMVTLLIVLVVIRTPHNLISLAGLCAFIVLSYITSVNPARVNWHPVFWGCSVQFYFAVVILRTEWGYDIFKWLGDRMSEFLAYSNAGASFVFGDNYNVHFFAFAIMPMVVFFSSVTSVLYYLGVLQALVRVIGRFLAICLGTTPAESLVAAANIFMGMTDSPLLVRPFVPRMTVSELHAIMTGGFATIAGSVFGAYIGFGVPANHLLAASVMSAPAALAISKLTYPETQKRQISSDEYTKMEKSPHRSLIEAAMAGASWSITLVGYIIVNVMAFLSILKFVNQTLMWFGERTGVEGFTFQLICSYVLYPVALFMGTEPRDCRRVAELVGIKTFTNEFIAYSELQKLLQNGKDWANYTSVYNVSDQGNVEYVGENIRLVHWNVTLLKGYLSKRSEVIATYALCGFSNFGSMGILLGGLTAIAPDRKHDMSKIILRSMIAGNVACFFTACIAGLFFEDFEDGSTSNP